jgi:hypothetical protein
VNAAEIMFDRDARPGLLERLANEFPASAEEWSRSVNRLNRWEEEHLLVEHPAPEELAQHRKYVERLLFFGQLCALVAAHPELGDVRTAQMVAATQEVLRNKRLMFHEPMRREEAEMILKEVFPEPGVGAAR